jgi:hypothetical protein
MILLASLLIWVVVLPAAVVGTCLFGQALGARRLAAHSARIAREVPRLAGMRDRRRSAWSHARRGAQCDAQRRPAAVATSQRR